MRILEFVRQKLKNLFGKYEEMTIISVAVVIGVAAGCGNIIFRSLISFFQELFFGIKSEVVLYGLQETPVWKIILIPAFGGLVVGLITKYFKSAKSHAPDLIKSISLNRPISPLTAVLKTITSAITLGSGGSAGRESPILSIGAAIGSGIGQLFKFSSNRLGKATACGASGGLAATFNAPMAGAMFSAEVLMGEYDLKTFSPVIIAAVSATVVSRAWFGNDVTFVAPPYELKSFAELPLYAVMGFVIAFISVFFIRFYYKITDAFKSMAVPVWLKPAIGGLLMGIIAVFCRNIMGVGYGTIMEILNGDIVGYILLVFIFLKIVATSLTLGSGGSGGLFVPTLFIGAATGGFFGWGVHALFPSIAAGSGTYALVAMAAMMAAVVRAPITSILLLFEITQSYHVILPVMISVIIANVVANRLEKDSIFTWELTREGFKLGNGIEQNVLQSIKVREVMLTDIIYFKDDTTFAEIRRSIEQKPHAYFPVINNDGFLTGVISLRDLKNVIFSSKKGENIIARDIGTRTNIITVTPDETLSQALLDFGIKDVGDLPVVERSAEGLKLIGLLRRSDMIIAYNKKMVDFNPEKN